MAYLRFLIFLGLVLVLVQWQSCSGDEPAEEIVAADEEGSANESTDEFDEENSVELLMDEPVSSFSSWLGGIVVSASGHTAHVQWFQVPSSES